MTETVPSSFPRSGHQGYLPGYAPKHIARVVDGKFVVGLSDVELLDRYKKCELLSRDLVSYCTQKRAENPSWSAQFVIDRTGLKIEAQGFGLSRAEINWVLQQIAMTVGWDWEAGRWSRLDVNAAINGRFIYAPPDPPEP